MARTYRIGCDIGGTFTDFILLNEQTGAFTVEKVLTTPADPSSGVAAGTRALLGRHPGYPAQTRGVVHATTLAVNAVIERKGAKTALLATKGFRDVLELRRHTRVSTYEMWNDPPEPLVPRYLRLPVTERTYSDGQVLTPVDADEVRQIAKTLRAEGVESVAIAFLHSYANPANEQQVAQWLAELEPELAVTYSAQVLPEYLEYERTSTTAINAYVKPIVARYLSRLQERLARDGFTSQLLITLSNGGLASVRTASELPVRLIESGPVAGAVAALQYANLAGLREVLSFDMGGTTAKACLIRGGALPLTSTLEVGRSERFQPESGYPVAIPAVDLIEVGAGGGSIARVNRLGLVQVGPDSAGADPGPMCYGFGGQEPTVTDADLVLGYLNPAYFLGGDMLLDLAAARRGIAERLAAPLGRDEVAAAWAVHEVVNENMAAAVKMHVVERGGDPSRATMVAFGGAGPVHVYNLARKLGVGTIFVPLRAGVMSALGLLAAPPAFDTTRTHKVPVDRLDFATLERLYQEMEAEIGKLLAEVDQRGQTTFARSVDMCYHGQGYQVRVPLPEGRQAALDTATLLGLFAQTYRAKYGYFYDDVPAEVVTARVAGRIGGHELTLQRLASGPADASEASKGSRLAYSARSRAMLPHEVYDRYRLGPGNVVAGPAIIEEREATTVVDAGGHARVDDYGTLVLGVR